VQHQHPTNFVGRGTTSFSLTHTTSAKLPRFKEKGRRNAATDGCPGGLIREEKKSELNPITSSVKGKKTGKSHSPGHSPVSSCKLAHKLGTAGQQKRKNKKKKKKKKHLNLSVSVSLLEKEGKDVQWSGRKGHAEEQRSNQERQKGVGLMRLSYRGLGG